MIVVGACMANSSKLLNAYERMVAAEEEKRRLMPERLVTLIADRPWIEAVSQHSQARQAFLEAAINFCRSEKAKAPKSSRETHAKPTIRTSTQEAHVP
ncbi:hypothetical protein [Microvirga makkahensis]|uniref:hypothetical protein n=1 Tax=Microvirga makkahensis TaxID=1128670 RepID=UPI00136949FA|nr:hypothetical protein [Microvirga makkahensis]